MVALVAYMKLNQLKSWLTEQLKLAEPLDCPSTMDDPQLVAVTASKKLGLLGYGSGELLTRAGLVQTPFDCAAVLVDCLAALPDELPSNGELLTLTEAAEYLGYQAPGLRKLVEQKRITYLQNGRGPIKFKQEWLDKFIEENSSSGLDNSPARAYRPQIEPQFGFDPSLLH